MSIIIIIGLVLLIPANMIKSLIHERERTQEEAIEEVSSKRGEAQTITGPVVSIPYYRYVRQYAQNDTIGKLVQYKDYIHRIMLY